MTRKSLTALLITACMVSMTACSGSKAQTETAAPTTTAAAATAAAAETTIKELEVKETTAEETEAAAEEEMVIVADSDRPYTLSYDPNAFERETPASIDDSDVYDYVAEDVEAPVYVAIQIYNDFPAETLTQGLIIQNNLEDTDAQMAYFGADGIETQSIYVETEVEGITRIVIFHVIPNGEGSILVETGGYIGMPESADAGMEELLGSFKLVD